MLNEVIFDVETQKLFSDTDDNKPSSLGISVVSVYTRMLDQNQKEIEGKMQSFWETDLAELWPLFQKGDRIIGFNSTKFDVPVLQPYTSIPLQKFNHFDILQKVKESSGRRISLDSLAKDTLGKSKTDVGTNAVLYWQKGDPESLRKLQSYCEADVAITRDLYDFVIQNKYLKYTDKWNTPRQIDLDFSYPASQKPPTEQIGMF
jgi:DEAD/DEAH box helicase domain-containing protein